VSQCYKSCIHVFRGFANTSIFISDIEFDIENDPTRCLYSLYQTNIFSGTSDVLRVPEVFDKPVFYSGSAKSAEVVQGAVEDCYLVSALSTMTSMDHLIQNLCVAVSCDKY